MIPSSTPTESQPDGLPSHERDLLTTELLDSMRALTLAIEKQLAQQRSWKLALRNGLLAGFGGILGATVVVSILISVLQPFRRLEAIGPMFDRLNTSLRQNGRH